MALVTCPDCNHEVSDTAPICPNCGRPIADKTLRALVKPRRIRVEGIVVKSLTIGCIGLLVIGALFALLVLVITRGQE